MAYSYKQYTGDGTTTNYVFDFGYLSQSHIHVKVDGVDTPFTFLTDFSIQIIPAPASGTIVEIRRITPLDQPAVDWVDGSTLTEADMDLDTIFNLYANQEARDLAQDSIGLDSEGIWDGRGRATRNFADPVAPDSLVTRKYFENVYTPELDAKVAAAAASASASASSAAASAQFALNSAESADDSAESLDEFLKRYMGARPSNPTTRYDGSPLQVGDLYYNSTVNEMRVWSAPGYWQEATPTLQSIMEGTFTEPIIATEGQTVVPVESGYDPPFIIVWLNGSQIEQPEIDVSDGENIVFVTPLAAGDEITYRAFGAFQVANVTASGIKYKLDAPGSEETTLDVILRDRVSVFRFMTSEQIENVRGNHGTIDVSSAIQAALDWANSVGGAQLYLPAGRYAINSTLNIYSNTMLSGDGDATVFDCTNISGDHVILAAGSLGPEVALAATSTRNEVSVSLVADHGAAEGDWYLIKSQRNALSSDAGEWQLGLPTGSFNSSYFAEILEVKEVTSPTAFTFQPALIFPDYRPDNSAETPQTTRSCSVTSGSTTVTLLSGTTAGLMVGQRIEGTSMGNDARVDLILGPTTFKLTVPATATTTETLTFRVYNRPASTVRKINWVENVRIRDLHVITGSASAFQFIQAKDCRVENVSWDMGDRTGASISFAQSFRCEAVGCAATHDVMPDDEHSASYNTFKVVSGWYCGFTHCNSTNGMQPFDITYTNGGNPSLFTWVNGCVIHNAHDNPFTTHSGSYGFTAIGNQCSNCWRGPSLRSRNALISDNVFQGNGQLMPYGDANTYGISLMDGWCIDTVIKGNKIENFDQGIVVWDYGAQGQAFDEQRILITDNQISRGRYGVIVAHDADEKTANMSGLIIKGNHFFKITRKGIDIPRYVNGVEIAGNTFLGPYSDATEQYGVYTDTNSANHFVRHNTFVNLGAAAVPIYLGNLTDTDTFPFATTPSNNGARTEGNIVFGDQSSSFQGFSYRDIKTVGVSGRSWSYPADVTTVSERSGGNSLALITDGASSSSLIFADHDAHNLGRITYNHADDTMLFTVGGSAVKQSLTYLRPGTSNQKTLGDPNFRWLNVYTQNVVLNPPASVVPESNGDVTFELTSNTALTVKVKGSDGVVRSATLTLVE